MTLPSTTFDLQVLPIDQIGLADPADRVPYEPSEQELKAFVRALQATGSLEHPIVVRPVSLGARPFELVAGRLRLEAARQLGWSSIPCHVQSLTREAAVMVGLLEDLAGKRQPQLVLAWRVLAVLEATGWTQAQLASCTRLSQGQISELAGYAHALPRKTVREIAYEAGADEARLTGLSRRQLRDLGKVETDAARRELLAEALENAAGRGRLTLGASEKKTRYVAVAEGSLRLDRDRISELGLGVLVTGLLKALWMALLFRAQASRPFAGLRRAKNERP